MNRSAPLLFGLLLHGSLFYLVPPTTALLAWLLFDERLAGLALPGMALAVWGVYLARCPPVPRG